MTKNLRFYCLALLCAVFSLAWGTEETITFSEQGYENGVEVPEVKGESFTITFDKGSNSNAPKYYNTGSAIRCYGGNSFTVSSESKITGINLTFASGEGTNAITTDEGTYEDGTWTGSASSVTFTIGGTTGHRRLASITVTIGGTPAVIVTKPTFSPAAGTYSEAQNVTISSTTEGATIYYTNDGTDPTSASTPYTAPVAVSKTTTLKAIAIKDGVSSAIAEAVYTIVAPVTIAEVREQETGSVFTQGIVTSIVGTTAYIQDATAAICVYGNSSVKKGDEITVTGTLSTYRGLLEITNPVCTVKSSGNTVEPTVKTIAEILDDFANDNMLQGWLVKIEEATVTAVSGQDTTIQQGENTITVRGISGVEIAVNDVITLTGNIGCFDNPQIANPTDVTVKGGEVTKKDPELAYNPASYTATIGAENTFPTLTNKYNVAVTYSSSDTKVATISAEGVVTLVAAGETVIKAEFAGNDEYEAGDATYTLTVKEAQQEVEGIKGDIVFSELGLENGVQYSDPFEDEDGVFIVTFAGGGNDGKYYTTGSGIRVYGGGTMTVEGVDGKNILKIEVIYDGNNKPATADVVDSGTYDPETGVWTGSSDKVVFTRPSGSGHWRVKAITVTVEDNGTTPTQRKDPELAYSASAYTATIGEENTFPTLTNEHHVAVTYSSSKPEVATISEEGVVTLVAEGETVIKAEFAGNDEYKDGSVSYTLTVVSAKAEAELAWSDETAEAFITDEVHVYPTLSNPHDLPVTYRSTQTSYATIDESTGEITLVKAGKTTIIAEFAGNDEYKKGSASYQLVVRNHAIVSTEVFELIDDVTTLAAGDEIIIVGAKASGETTAYYGLGVTQNANNRAAEEVILQDDNTIVPNSEVQRVVLEGDAENGWFLNVEEGYLYAASSSSNWLRTEEEADDNAKATIEMDEAGMTAITFQGANTRNQIRFNSNNNPLLFSCYASDNSNVNLLKVQLYRKQVIEVPVTAAGYATLYYSNKNLVVPAGVKAFTCATTDGKTSVETRSYKIIPAGSAVVLQAAEGTYKFGVSTVGDEPVENNMLLGTDEETAPVAPATGGDYKFFKLANDPERGLGFYGVEKGFKNGAHKAYLAVPASVAADFYTFDFTDGIQGVKLVKDQNTEIYTLTGVRVSASQLPAGIYIVNGKKVVIK